MCCPNSLLRLVPPNTKLATTSGVCRKASSSPLGACTRTPLVSMPPQPQLHHTLPVGIAANAVREAGLKVCKYLATAHGRPVFYNIKDDDICGIIRSVRCTSIDDVDLAEIGRKAEYRLVDASVLQ